MRSRPGGLFAPTNPLQPNRPGWVGGLSMRVVKTSERSLRTESGVRLHEVHYSQSLFSW